MFVFSQNHLTAVVVDLGLRWQALPARVRGPAIFFDMVSSSAVLFLFVYLLLDAWEMSLSTNRGPKYATWAINDSGSVY